MASKATGRRRTLGSIGAAIACTLVVALVPASADAAPPSNVQIRFGLPPVQTSTVAGDEVEYTISFTTNDVVTSAAGRAITLNAAGVDLAPGTIFPANAPATEGGAFYSIQVNNGPRNVVIAPVQRLNGNQTVAIPTFGTGTNAAIGDKITVAIGYLSDEKVENPSTPCTCQIAAATTVPPAPTEFTASNAYEVVEGPGDLDVYDDGNAMTPSSDGQSTPVGTTFAVDLQAQLLDGQGNPVQDETITFTAPDPDVNPADGSDDTPSGTFAGGTMDGRVFEAVTDSNGIATASDLTANGVPGSWEVTATTTLPGVAPATFDLVNQGGATASTVDLVLNPTSIEGNGASTTTATATVEDSFGNPVADQDVEITSNGDQDISDVQELSGGRYRATITSTPESGMFTITATNTTANPDIFDTATLTQTADTTAPQARIVEKPAKRIRSKRARFTFEANQADVESFECKIDDRNYKPCESPKQFRVSVGNHTFRVRATDQAGNRGPADSYSFERAKKRK